MSVSAVSFGLVSSYAASSNGSVHRSAETTGTVANATSKDFSIPKGTETTGAVAMNFENGIYQNTGNGFEAAA